MQKIVAGIVAGAAGTVALDVATYLDMAIRGRSASNAPAQLVDTVAKGLHLSFSSSNDQQAKNRESGLGALLGYVNGLGTGVGLWLASVAERHGSFTIGSYRVGLAAMVASDVPLIVSHISNPNHGEYRGGQPTLSRISSMDW